MSLYTEGEICGDCIHAVLFDCGNCLKECKLDAESDRDYIHGKCPVKTTVEVGKNDRSSR